MVFLSHCLVKAQKLHPSLVHIKYSMFRNSD
jgi:hypothetical protein